MAMVKKKKELSPKICQMLTSFCFVLVAVASNSHGKTPNETQIELEVVRNAWALDR